MLNVDTVLQFIVGTHIRKGGGPRVVVSTAAFHARVRGSVPGLGGLKETKMFLPHPRVKVSIVGSLRDREVACSASDRQGSNFESCVWRTVSSQSSHHPQEVLLAQFSLYVHKGGLKPDSFHLFHIRKNPLLAKLSYSHPLGAVSRYRDPELQVGENYSYFVTRHAKRYIPAYAAFVKLFMTSIKYLNLMISQHS